MDQEQPSFTTSTGFKLSLKPVSPFLIQKVQASGEYPKPPTYEVTTAAGSKEVHEHDAESIKTASDAEKAAWVAYTVKSRAVQSEVNDRLVRLILLRGIESEVPDYGWDREQEEVFGIKVPKDPNDRKVHYLLTEAIGTADDIANLITEVIALSGVSQEAIETARASFRRALRRNATNGVAEPEPVTLDAQPPVQ